MKYVWNMWDFWNVDNTWHWIERSKTAQNKKVASGAYFFHFHVCSGQYWKAEQTYWEKLPNGRKCFSTKRSCSSVLISFGLFWSGLTCSDLFYLFLAVSICFDLLGLFLSILIFFICFQLFLSVLICLICFDIFFDLFLSATGFQTADNNFPQKEACGQLFLSVLNCFLSVLSVFICFFICSYPFYLLQVSKRQSFSRKRSLRPAVLPKRLPQNMFWEKL